MKRGEHPVTHSLSRVHVPRQVMKMPRSVLKRKQQALVALAKELNDDALRQMQAMMPDTG